MDSEHIMPERRVLVVEDDADQRWGVCALLELDGHAVDGAGDGLEGLRALQSRVYDVALVDLHLPGMSGYDLARRTRRAGNHISLIAITGKGLDSDRETALDAGFDAYVLKPVSSEALIALVTDPPRRA